VLGYPAGPVISEFCRQHRKNTTVKIIKDNQSTKVQVKNKETKQVYELPVAMARSGDLNFSFSGLKTAFKELVKELSGNSFESKGNHEIVENLDKIQILDLCVTFEHAALTQLGIKLEKAIKKYKPNQLWLGGGVVASAKLRSVLRSISKRYDVEVKYPYGKKLTTDNAAMIGVAAQIQIAQFGLKHNPEKRIFEKDFEAVDRNPTLAI
jgi:tRNA A37 threonylcarbamoyltransferase TsaD